ncbi:OLC1v1026920C1 [Oldenlandia corymbosa var. corymbosa]|uniref:OLC1v1026920C1 n=1 Tax=Oldenlandia corymbosa var. corymbosa TaxID=529605 RepID=A0AAV1C8M6_OLDCO|nr:OLC1v1026920C1 [Oldenlandia corymbosa var. corymbosa]
MLFNSTDRYDTSDDDCSSEDETSSDDSESETGRTSSSAVHEAGLLDINAPVLQHLDIKDCFSTSLLITNVGSLNQAKLDLHNIVSCQSVIKCFEAFHNIKFLSLHGVLPTNTGIALNVDEAGFLSSLMTFRNLTHLTIGGQMRVASNASFLSSILFRGSKSELGMLKYIMKHGNRLRKVDLHPVGNKPKCQLRTQRNISLKIVNFKKGSSRCKIGLFEIITFGENFE